LAGQPGEAAKKQNWNIWEKGTKGKIERGGDGLEENSEMHHGKAVDFPNPKRKIGRRTGRVRAIEKGNSLKGNWAWMLDDERRETSHRQGKEENGSVWVEEGEGTYRRGGIGGGRNSKLLRRSRCGELSP